ncbi:polyprenyl synthetase family protein [Microbacterium sp. JB110]|uniref:polyprenyl synthetase family protein n=1 Tax=Microbacterium sp. JB110 TaxID=2024477 RepID=UPI000B357262|nr:polyprenyl synthetase family protein [Microbacterium sp. JB110]RCS62731.1 polyprenyl synthetase family protein [Microbacterium sp. JB110]
MTPTQTLIEAISQRLESFVTEKRIEAAGSGTEAALFVEHAATALTGGKRLRGRFCATGWHAVADRPAAAADLTHGSDAIGVAAALEVFQAAALVHDDIIDNADTRRGRPSAHRALEAAHSAAGWSGDAASFGRSGALLLGDLLVAWSDDLLEQSLADAPRLAGAAARAEYGLMRREVTLGQFLDVAEESAWSVAPEAELPDRALRIASYKSARYSVQQPLVIGAALAGADGHQLDALRGFGLPIGLAFQLRDDVLGVFGDEARTGKPAGDDLREGKRTLLVALARAELAGTALRSFDELFGEPDLDATQVAVLAHTIRDTGALQRVEERIARFSDDADRALTGAPLGDKAVNSLRDLARDATQRTA